MCASCDVREYTFCAALSPQEMGSIEAIVRSVRLAPGQILFQEGEEASDVFNLVRGVVKLYKLLPDGRRQITGFLFPGDFLGIAGAGGYSYNAEAVTETGLCRFPRRQLFALFERFPKLEHRLFAIATDELTAAQDQMLLLGRKTAEEKVASFLCRLADRIDLGETRGGEVPVPMTRSDIGDYLGLTVETVSRTLSRLRKRGLIAVPDVNRVVLLRREAIEEIAEAY